MKYAVAGLLIALIGTIGSLYLSIGMHLKACPLCFYQRTFTMATAAVLGVGLLADRKHAGMLCLVSVPLASAGLGVAAFHEYLLATGVLECPNGLFSLGSAPLQSLIILVILATTVIAGGWTERPKSGGAMIIGPAVVAGAILAWGAVASSPPLPPVPKAAYDPERQPLDTCRPPFNDESINDAAR